MPTLRPLTYLSWFHGGPRNLKSHFFDVSSDLLFSIRSLVCRFASSTSSLVFSLSSFVISWIVLKVERDSLFRSLCNWLNITRLVISDLSFINRGRIPLPSTRFPSRRAWRTCVDGIFLSQKEFQQRIHCRLTFFLSSSLLPILER